MSRGPQFDRWAALGLLPGLDQARRVADAFPWDQAFALAAAYADDFMAEALGRQATTEGWGRRLRAYVQIVAWRQLCAGASSPAVAVPQHCIDHWRLAWVSGVHRPEPEETGAESVKTAAAAGGGDERQGAAEGSAGCGGCFDRAAGAGS